MKSIEYAENKLGAKLSAPKKAKEDESILNAQDFNDDMTKVDAQTLNSFIS
jgi:hypothetical protein